MTEYNFTNKKIDQIVLTIDSKITQLTIKKKKKKDVNTRLDDSEAIYIIFNIKDEAINKRREGIEQMKEERHGEGSTKG